MSDDPGDPPKDPLPGKPDPLLAQRGAAPQAGGDGTGQMPPIPRMMPSGHSRSVNRPPVVSTSADGCRHQSLGRRYPRFTGQGKGAMPPKPEPPGSLLRGQMDHVVDIMGDIRLRLAILGSDGHSMVQLMGEAGQGDHSSVDL